MIYRYNGTIPLDIPNHVFVALSEHMTATNCKEEIWDVAGRAISEWLAGEAQRIARTSERAMDGHQWKNVLLPNGSALRTVFGGIHYHARVEQGYITFNGARVSPSEFVNSVGGTGRNAWRVLWVMLPHEKRWRLAAELRDECTSRCA